MYVVSNPANAKYQQARLTGNVVYVVQHGNVVYGGSVGTECGGYRYKNIQYLQVLWMESEQTTRIPCIAAVHAWQTSMYCKAINSSETNAFGRTTGTPKQDLGYSYLRVYIYVYCWELRLVKLFFSTSRTTQGGLVANEYSTRQHLRICQLIISRSNFRRYSERDLFVLKLV